MGKYEELEKIRKLKDEGTLTEGEFEEEKRKILNSENNKKIKFSKAKIFFILTFIFAVISIFNLISWCNAEKEYRDYMDEHIAADIELKWGGISENRYEKIQENKSELSEKTHILEMSLIGSVSATVILLGTAIVLKIKKK